MGACCLLPMTPGLAASPGSAPVPVQTLADTKPIPFNLPADLFPRAMQAFYSQSNVEVLYVTAQNDLRTIRTRAVAGTMSPLQALQRMLKGTPLTYTVDSDHSVIIHRRKEEPRPGSALPGPHIQEQPFTAESALAEIRINGNRSPQGDFAGAPYSQITPHDFSLAPFPTLEDTFYQLPINSLNAPRQDLGIAANYNWGTGLNLRGLGLGATLVLVDGERQPLSGYNGDFVDVSNIPASFVERVEILPDGASALYGSDAIAGVVNIILRKDLEGAETTLHGGTAIGGDRQVSVSHLSGLHWDGGRAVLGYEFLDATALPAADRAYAADADKTPLGGRDYRSYYADPGNLLDPRTGLPLSNTPLLQNQYQDLDLFPQIRQHSLYARLSQDVSDAIDVFAAVRMTQRESFSNQFPLQQALTVPASNPYYTGDGTTPQMVGYSFLDSLGPVQYAAQTRNYHGSLGASFELGGGWQAVLSGSAGAENLHYSTYNVPDSQALNTALASSDPAVAFNPFGMTSASTLQAIDRERRSQAHSSVTSGSLAANGPVIEAPAGTVQLSVGIERREETLKHEVPDPTDPREATVSQRYTRGIDAIFTELAVPLVAGRPGASEPRLELRLAGRYERYSDFGDTFSPGARLAWHPLQGLTLRGSWGHSFRAPTLDDLYDTAQNGVGLAILRDPLSPTGTSVVLARQGNNPSLGKESAETWTVGLDLTPERSAGTRLSLSYYHIDYRNQIAAPAATDPFDILVNASQWSSVIIRNPSAAQIAAVCNGPDPMAMSREACLSSAPAAIVDFRLANLSLTRSRGVDMQASQHFDTGIGGMDLGLMGAYVLSFDQALSSTSPAVSQLDTVGNLPSVRLRASLEWNSSGAGKPGWGAIVASSYTNAYDNPGSTLAPHMPSFASLDLQLSYSPAGGGGWSGTQWCLNIVNLLNENPPFVDGMYGYDRLNTQPLGRVVGLTLTKHW